MSRETRRTAQQILQQTGFAAPRIPPLEELAEMAREHLKLTDADRAQRERLVGGDDVLFVSAAAAAEFCRVTGLQPEEGRRRLTEVLVDATQNAQDLSLWRARSRSTGLDVQARISIEGRLLVVAHVTVRDYR